MASGKYEFFIAKRMIYGFNGYSGFDRNEKKELHHVWNRNA
jgi:hypothetical protein